jgi:hypothetical protein
MQAQTEGAHMRRATGFLCLLAGALLGACSSSGSPSAKPMSYISGAPRSTATVGERYSFQPATSEAGEKKFTIQNRPQWAQFSAETGLLAGTPAAADVGRYSDIRITVDTGGTKASLPAFSIEVVRGASAGPSNPGGSSGPVVLNWEPPVENTDGSALTNLAGYRIYSGQTEYDLEPRAQIDNPGISTYVVESPAAGERYFAIASVSEKGIESQLSNVVYAGGD